MPEFLPRTVFMDSNVLFSASYIATSSFLNFWKMVNVTPVTCPYAVAEVCRHIVLPGQQLRFDELMSRTRLVSDADQAFVPHEVRLVEKDRPILAAAIAANVNYLITGDKSHFTHLYSKRTSHVYVISPADFLFHFDDRLLK